MQEISGTIERTTEQLSEIQEQVSTLEDTQPVFVKIRVFVSRVPLPPVEAESGCVADAADVDANTADPLSKQSDDTSAADGACEQRREPVAASPDAVSSEGGSKAQENGAVHSAEVKGEEGGDASTESQEEAKAEPEIEYEVIETANVQFTVDRYTESMGREVEALNAQVEDLTQRRNAVLEAFNEMVAHFGERPQAVKESEWWTDFLRFLKPFHKIQTAIVKQRAADEEAAERKRKKEQSGGTTHRQRG
jgi:hypothetical protein